jgi:tetratricopeptide (TPR) repeat protein
LTRSPVATATGFHRAALFALLLVTGLVYHGVVRNGFVWDDAHTIANNRSLDSLTSISRWFLEPETGTSLRDVNYRPVLTASFAVDVALWGRRPAAFHATNLAIHLIVTWLVYTLAWRVWRHPGSAFTAAVIVALHPINAEAVNYVSARSSLLSAAFALAAIAVSQPATGRAAGFYRVASGLALGALALGVKESLVVLPVLMIVWSRLTSDAGRSWTQSLRGSLPWWGLVGLFLAWRAMVLTGNAPQGVGDGVWQPVLFAIKLFVASLWSWFVPIGFAVDHGWSWTIAGGEAALLIAAALGAVGATVALWRWDRRIGWCVMWFWVALLPLAALPWVSRLTLYQDHRVYLAGVGLAWASSEMVRRLHHAVAPHPGRRVAAATLAVTAVAVAIIMISTRTAVWRDADRLWAHTLAQYPSSVLARNHQALQWLEAGDIARARDAFEASAALAPDFAVTHNYLGVAYAREGDIDRAIREFTTALRLSPLFLNARLNLGNAYERTGQWDLALAAYEQGIPDAPWAVPLMERSAKLLERMGKPDEAKARHQKILSLDPSHPLHKKLN